MVTHILTPVDGSMHSLKAAELAGDLAQKYDAKVTLLQVMASIGSSRTPKELREVARLEHTPITERDILLSESHSQLSAAENRAKDNGATKIECEVSVGDPSRMIIDYAQKNGVDMIVMGTRGLGDLKGLLLGSVSHKVVQFAECPCLLVR